MVLKANKFKKLAVWSAALLALGGLLSACSKNESVTEAKTDTGPANGGALVYLEQQAHTNLYPPAGGFYPNGGVLNQAPSLPGDPTAIPAVEYDWYAASVPAGNPNIAARCRFISARCPA